MWISERNYKKDVPNTGFGSWIPFDKTKPKDGQSVLAITSEGEMEVYQFDADWETCLCKYGGAVKVFNITHWMPLPEAPKEDV